MKKILFTLATSCLLIVSACTNTQNDSIQTDLSPAEFTKEIQNIPEAQLLDVRTHAEFASGHLPNALNINWTGDNFEKEVAQLDKEKPVLIYCQSGRRSDAAADKMREMGFKNVLELDGGIAAWNAAEMPVTSE